jgi:hypothetical protein
MGINFTPHVLRARVHSCGTNFHHSCVRFALEVVLCQVRDVAECNSSRHTHKMLPNESGINQHKTLCRRHGDRYVVRHLKRHAHCVWGEQSTYNSDSSPNLRNTRS